MEYRLFVVLAPIAAGTLIVTAWTIARYRRLRISRSILAYLVSVALLLGTNTLELIVPSEWWTLVLARIVHVAWHAVVVSWFAFAAVYAGREHLASTRTILLLLVFPVVEGILVNTGIGTEWFYRSVEFFHVYRFTTLRAEYGVLFWINGAFIYGLLIAGIVMILHTAFDRPDWFQRQTLLVVAGAIVPIVVNSVYVFRIVPTVRKDFTSIAFALSGLAFYFGVQRYSLLSKRPISRSAILEDVQSAVLVVDHDREIIDANPAAQAFIGDGWSDQSLVDTLLAEIRLDQHLSFETSVVTDTDDMRSFDVTIRPIIERTGVLIATVVTITETTAWLQLKQRNQEIHLRMIEQERLATIGLISANIAHEVKNPLTILRSTFYAAVERARSAPVEGSITTDGESSGTAEIDGYVESFQRGFDRIVTVIQSMTNHIRGVSEEEQVPTDLQDLIESTLQLTRSAYKNIASIETEFGEIPLVSCVPSAISQVLLNIVLNAIYAIESNRSSPNVIRITTYATDRYVGCRISNTGPPIPEEIKERIFEPFFTTKPPGEGSGLGLSISREIVEQQHKGRITLVELEGMTGFSIELPRIDTSLQ